MPYLYKSFTATMTNYEQQSWTYEKRTGEELTLPSANGYSELIEYTSNFYNNLKSMLEKVTNVSITFDDDNHIINIFGIDLMIKCLSTMYISGKSDLKNVCCVLPICIIPRLQNFSTSYNNWPKNNIVEHNNIYNGSVTHYQNAAINAGFSNELLIQQIGYKIKIWYNKNYIMCNYTSFKGNEYPLFCLIQGKLVNGSTNKPVYICANPNVTSFNWFTCCHYIMIPEMNTDKTKYIDYLPSLGNTTNGTTNGSYNFLDNDYYPDANIMSKLSLNGNINEEIFLPLLTAYHGIVQFDNCYNVTRDSMDANIVSQFTPDSYYEIDSEQYYYPGFITPSTSISKSTVQVMFKL